ncbi:MAG: Y-family DNA polymerase [Thiomonas sp.]
MLWCALRLPIAAEPHSPALQGLATWALQFTPRVALCEEAVLMEVQGSLRLFGGAVELAQRVQTDAATLGVDTVAWAPTALGALALARAGDDGIDVVPLAERLDPLPLAVLSATHPHADTLAQLGCRTLGELRVLPRSGVTRRFGAALLDALDQAYGLRSSAFSWVALPETFRARLDLMARVDSAPALLFAARRLLLQLQGWLVARNAAVTAFTLRWQHDGLHAQEQQHNALVIRTAAPARDMEHLSRLLAEHLARVQLGAPVETLILEVESHCDFRPSTASLLPDAQQDRDALQRALERIAARLGEDRVLRPVLCEDARPEWMQRWVPVRDALRAASARPDALPQPTFLLPAPLRLAVRGERPLYQGELQLLLGPHRVEGGWWHRVEEAGVQTSLQVARDYWVAKSAHAGVLWVFQTRQGGGQDGQGPAWFLHGVFA